MPAGFVGAPRSAFESQTTRLEAPLVRQLKWAIILRLVAVTSVALAYFLFQLGSESKDLAFDFPFRGAAAVYLASLVYLALFTLRRPGAETQAYIQFVGDLLLITALIYYVGGISSPFSILYLIVVTEAAVFLRRQAGVHIATLAWLLYAGVVLAMALGWLAGPGVETKASISFLRIAYNLTIHLMGFYAVAFMTSHLAANVVRAERALERKGERLAELRVVYRDVIESIPSGLVTTDRDGVITSANAAAQEILERPAETAVGSHVCTLGLFDREEWDLLSDGSSDADSSRLETEYEVGGRQLAIGYALSPLAGDQDEPAGFIVIFQDLSDWRQLQAEVRLQERMAAVGQMASGLAHEIGNPLAAISGSVQMLTSGVPETSPKRKLLDIILKESQRLDRTIKGFLQFARPKEAASVRFDVAALLTENVELLRNSAEIKKGHVVDLALEPNSVFLVGDPDQISQIFWNLARNSIRAMAEGGRLSIVGSLEGDQYHLDFLDTGCGMTAEEKDRMFHPFRSYFDGGSGIGMAIVYRIVEEHHGQLHVDSKPGEGTRVRVDLPGAVAASTAIPAEA